MTTALGRLEAIPLRQVWPLEATDFTPWLAAAENLTLLGETLDPGELQLQGTEVGVGSFNLDILARDIEGHAVVIENQFGPTDHAHLGQILTYVAGQKGQAATVVWIAERIREEHRAAIDWLNASTIQDFNFFGVEVEALRIGESLSAPWFNVVTKPNSWTRGVGQVTRAATGNQLDERAKGYLAYWAGFGSFLQENRSSYKISTPSRDYSCTFGIGRSGFVLSDTAGFRDRKLGVEIYISHPAAKRAFNLLKADQSNIEAEFGEQLDWQRLDDKRGCRIATYRSDLDSRNEGQRRMQYAWFLDHMQRFAQVFGNRIRSLPLEEAAVAEPTTDVRETIR